MFHPRSRNDQGDYCRQADLMSAQRLVCLRHDAGNVWLTRSVPPKSNITQAQARSDIFIDGGGI
jgi:hypothetical protein